MGLGISKLKERLAANYLVEDIIKNQVLQNISSEIIALEAALPNEVNWDSEIAEDYQKIQKLKSLFLKDELVGKHQYKKLIHDMDKFMEHCQQPEYHIALVGAIKAGKSTLINALLNEDLASTSVTPETASLTKFRSSQKTNYVKIHFYSKKEWKELWSSVKEARAEVFLQEYRQLRADREMKKWIDHEVVYKEFAEFSSLKEEIKKWTSSKVASHYFVKEVEVGLVDFNMPEEVVFVDTPGLDDPVRYRSDITKDYIERANAVFVCVKSDALTGQELETIYQVFANCRFYPEKVHIIGTQIDGLNDPINDWQQQKEEWLKHLSQSDCYGDRALAEKNLVGVASYLYNECQKYLIHQDQSGLKSLFVAGMKFQVLTWGDTDINACIDKLLDCSNIISFKEKIQIQIINQYKKLIKEELQRDYEDLIREIRASLESIKAMNIEIFEATTKPLEELVKQREEVEENLLATQRERQEIETVIEVVKSMSQQRAHQIYNQLLNIKF